MTGRGEVVATERTTLRNGLSPFIAACNLMHQLSVKLCMVVQCQDDPTALWSRSPTDSGLSFKCICVISLISSFRFKKI